MFKFATLTGAVALCIATTTQAQVTVDEPWVRATVASQTATGAFMRLTSATVGKLVQVGSPIAENVEIHEMRMENQIMKMREIPSLALPAGQAVELKPGGYHIMLLNLKDQVREGDKVPLTLTVENADGQRSTVDVQASVRALTSGGHHHGGH